MKKYLIVSVAFLFCAQNCVSATKTKEKIHFTDFPNSHFVVCDNLPGQRLKSQPYFIIATDPNLYNRMHYFINHVLRVGDDTDKLSKIMTKHGSDKGDGESHNYTQLYKYIWKEKRKRVKTVFELGILNCGKVQTGKTSGGSLRGWKEYFPNAKIYGADFNKDLLFDENRIKTFYTDIFDDKKTKEMWDRVIEDNAGKLMDIIVEDGPHTLESSLKFLENSFQYLKPGGWYIIEDYMCGIVNDRLSDDKILRTYAFLLKNNYKAAIVYIPVEKARVNESYVNVLVIIQK